MTDKKVRIFNFSISGIMAETFTDSEGKKYTENEFLEICEKVGNWPIRACFGYIVLGMRHLKYKFEDMDKLITILDDKLCKNKVILGEWNNCICIDFITEVLKESGYSLESIDKIIKGMKYAINNNTLSEAERSFIKFYPLVAHI